MSEGNSDPLDPTPAPFGLKRKKSKARKEYVKDPPFEGNINDLKGRIYDTGGNAKDRFATTTRAIGEYVAQTYKSAGEFSNALDPTIWDSHQSDILPIRIQTPITSSSRSGKRNTTLHEPRNVREN